MKSLILLSVLALLLAFQSQPNIKQKTKATWGKCSTCHRVTKEFIGSPLKNIRKKRTKEWIYQFILNPASYIELNPEAKKFCKGITPPSFILTTEEIESLLDYIDSLPDDSEVKKVKRH